MKWTNYFLVTFLVVVIVTISDSQAQQSFLQSDFTLLNSRLNQKQSHYLATIQEDSTRRSGEFPSPKSVLYKSLIIPGWGQVVNKQIWKVPIVYGLFAGLGAYTVYLNGQYQDYRAAYYNATQGEDNDFKFGETPERLEGVNTNQLQSTRNNLRNQRDMSFVYLGLAYGLNALDAYIYAHMRSFDVSDDLGARATVYPTILAEGNPGIRINFSIFKK